MKVAFVISSRAMAGMELRAARVARLAAERGHEMHFGCPAGSQLDRRLGEVGIRRFPLSIAGSLDLYSGLKLARYLRSGGIELVMPFSGKDYWMAVFAARLARIPVLINRSTSNSPNRLSVPLMSGADGVVAVSRGIRDVLTKRGIPEEKITVVHLGVNTEIFSPGACPSKEEVRARLGLPAGKVIVGSLARSAKGQRQLLEAHRMLAERRGDLCYFFAGEYLPERLGGLVAGRPDLAGRVFLKGLVPHEEVPGCLKALDIVAMLPQREPFSNSVIEAMAMEKPVVLSRTLGNIEAVEDGISGILVERGDIAALAERLKMLIDSPERREEMGRKAAERVRRLFTEDAMMDAMESLWQGVARPRAYSP